MVRQTLSLAGGYVDACEVCGAEGDAGCPNCGEVLCWDHIGQPCWRHCTVVNEITDLYNQRHARNPFEIMLHAFQVQANEIDLARIEIDSLALTHVHKMFKKNRNLLLAVTAFLDHDFKAVAVTKLLIYRQQKKLHASVTDAVRSFSGDLSTKDKSAEKANKAVKKQRQKKDKKKMKRLRRTEHAKNASFAHAPDDELCMLRCLDAGQALRLHKEIRHFQFWNITFPGLISLLADFPDEALQQQKLEAVATEMQKCGKLPARSVIAKILERLQLLVDFALATADVSPEE